MSLQPLRLRLLHDIDRHTGGLPTSSLTLNAPVVAWLELENDKVKLMDFRHPLNLSQIYHVSNSDLQRKIRPGYLRSGISPPDRALEQHPAQKQGLFLQGASMAITDSHRFTSWVSLIGIQF